MDYLIQAIGNFSITEDEDKFTKTLDAIIDNFDKVALSNQNNDWETLKSNYSKLRYLQETINFYYIKETERFFECVEKFMKDIDTQTREYLKDMYSIREEDRVDFEQIEQFFNESLFEKDIVTRIGLVIKGYQILVPIVEKNIRKKWEYSVNDNEILSFKRHKL